MKLSIRNQLLWILLPITLLVWILTSAIIYQGVKQEVNELIDAQLVQSSTVLLNLLSHEFNEEKAYRESFDDDIHAIPHRLNIENRIYEQKLAFQMWMLPGHLALRSQFAPELPLSSSKNGFSDEIIDGQEWRVYVLTDREMGLQVQVAESTERRNFLRDQIALRAIVPVFIAIPLLVVMVWWGVGHVTRPLRRLADEVQYRETDKLHPIEKIDVPIEALPLVEALNKLFVRLESAIETERQFTADAAHELRTPLAALKTQAQVALQAENREEVNEALYQLSVGVDRASHLIQQLLTLARIEHSNYEAEMEVISFHEFIEHILADMCPQALAKKINLGFEPRIPCTVTGNRGLLEIMIRNIIDNAIKYTPDEGIIKVSLDVEYDRVIFCVADSGPGIQESEIDRVFERFYRRLGNKVSGSGLGLSIIKRIAEIHQAQIRIKNIPDGGLQFKVSLSGNEV